MAWDDFIKAFMYDPNNFDYQAFTAKAEQEHRHDVEIRDAKIRQLSESDATRAAEVDRLKAANYDLLMKVPVKDSPAADLTDQADDPELNVTREDLFKKE